MSQHINFDPLQERLPFVSSIVSSLYKLSSFALFLITPAMLWISRLSLQSAYQFSEARYWVFHPIGKILVVIACALCFYHGLVSLYYSLINTYRIADRPLRSGIIILILTALLAGGLGYWLW
jgi:succinate dehydrogenase/fumarate reductase cytochrome b subunit